MGNATLLNQQLQANSSVLDKHIFDNVTLLNNAVTANSINLQNMINQSILQTNSTISALNSSINLKYIQISNNFSSINSTLIQHNDTIFFLLNIVSDLQNQLVDKENAELEPELEISDFQLPELICNQIGFVQQFDISTISQTISSSNFTSSYVFGNTQIVNNAYINILDNSLTNSFSLYDQQTYYYHIKVQIGSQSMQTGSIISDQSIKSMNNINILSKIASMSSISSQLYILSRVSSGSSIRNLHVKMLISSSSNGNISLFGSQSGMLNIKNYQVSGAYYSQKCMSLCVQNSNQAQISITNVNFKPDIYTLGNQSSCLFAYISTSSIQIKLLVLQVGSISVNSLQTAQSSSSLIQFQYGGIVSQISASSVIIQNTAIQVFLKQTTNCINSSGIVIGASSTTMISINNLCVLEYSTFVGSVVNQSGVFGTIGGKISMFNVNINYSASGNGKFSNFGTIGVLIVDCTTGSFSNLQISFISINKMSYDDSEVNVATLIGSCLAKNMMINILHIQGNVSASSCVALVTGQQNSNVTINNLFLSNSNIFSSQISSGVSGLVKNICYIQGLLVQNIFVQSRVQGKAIYSAGIFGYTSNNQNKIQQCTINNITVFSQTLNNAESFASCMISYSINSSIIFEEIQINSINIEAQSQNMQGVSSGYISYLDNCQIQLSNLQSENITIVSNSCIPRSSGIIGIALFSQIHVIQSYINNSNILGTDVMYRNTGDLQSVSLCTGVLADSINSSILVKYISVIQSIITSTARQLSAAAGITGYLLNSNSTIRNINTINIFLNCTSLEWNSHSGAINSIVQDSCETMLNILIQYINIITHSLNDSYVGGITGWQNANYSSISAVQVQWLTIQTTSDINVISGGFIGQLKINYIILQLLSISNSNISSQTRHNNYGYCYTGSIIGKGIDITTFVIDNVKAQNIINNNVGYMVFSGAFIGALQTDTHIVANSLIKIMNSEINSIQIYYTAYNYKLINIILGLTTPATNVNTIQISSTKSLGFSSVNGVSIGNCENVQVQQINGNYQISENGCI
ncbi:Hypothetical_protein [Hexamita inflata]|uniref:Hypothetical_protein n=1 Tax=Hexamita inflata TaxID=28002 RepID=A0AA86U5S3_9EUKA|nr:Hypothetical protein HINF_LOCUS31470 [Hexamita inflata]CAI9943826.1 Hypothetical protein HINF_LOCUS31471 [Hexamita inflata]